MIKSIYITNFQSHKETQLKFHPGVNVIVGESDSGKTAVLRALKWVLTNRPGGDAIRSNWGGSTSVTLRMKDSATVARVKTNTENSYKLDTTEFKAFGTDVPEEIAAALNMNEINIQSQLDLPFLLRDSPGQVAGHFNRIAHLDAIDKSMQLVEKWTRELNRKLKYGEDQLIKQQEELKEYDYLPAMEKMVSDAEWIEEQQLNTSKKISRLEKLTNSIRHTNEVIEEKSQLLLMEKSVEEAVALLQKIESKKEQKRKLSMTLITIHTKEEKIKTRQVTITNESAVESAMKAMAAVQRKQVDLRNLKKLIEHEKEHNILITKQQKAIQVYETAFHKELGEVCPLCGQEVK